MRIFPAHVNARPLTLTEYTHIGAHADVSTGGFDVLRSGFFQEKMYHNEAGGMERLVPVFGIPANNENVYTPVYTPVDRPVYTPP